MAYAEPWPALNRPAFEGAALSFAAEEQLWSAFLREWPKERLRSMTIDQYTDTQKATSYTYWLEFGLRSFGKIRGGSAFKFGVYRQKEPKIGDSARYRWDGTYAFDRSLGDDAASAFAQVHARLSVVLDAIERRDLAAVEAVELHSGLKWKTALLYQDRSRPQLFGVLLKKALLVNYRRLDPDAQLKSTPQHVMYRRLLEEAGPSPDIIALADRLWANYQASQGPAEISAAEEMNAGPRCYKIAPGKRAQAWHEWRRRGIASIGWPDLGDLTSAKDADYRRAFARYSEQHGKTGGVSQVKTFGQLRPGDRIVANRGKEEVVGIGTVVRGYCFRAHTLMVGTEEHPHQVDVAWEDVAPFGVGFQPRWGRTVVRLTDAQFALIRSMAGPAKNAEAAHPSKAYSGKVHNEIYQGPPGTGKTYFTKRRALELLGDDAAGVREEGTLNQTFRQMQADGRIQFVTFHQSYGYEEFVEGIRPILALERSDGLAYTLQDGPFKRIAVEAAYAGLTARHRIRPFGARWSQLLAEVESRGSLHVCLRKGFKYRVKKAGKFTLEVARVAEAGAKAGADLTPRASQQTFAVASSSAPQKRSTLVRAQDVECLWSFYGPSSVPAERLTYAEGRDVFAHARGGDRGADYTACWLTYVLLHKRMLPDEATVLSYAEKAKVVREVLARRNWDQHFQFSADTPQYVLIVDEINRGNISKILGELITLLEPSKRIQMTDAVALPLAYSSPSLFAVPPNLHILGTMNTADRSIASMDIALRRRFTFHEMSPDVKVLRAVLERQGCAAEVAELAVDLFEAINERTALTFGERHQFGHAHFMQARTLADLMALMLNAVIPTLLACDVGGWEKVCYVLGTSLEQLVNQAAPNGAEEGGHTTTEAATRAQSFVVPTVPRISPGGDDVDWAEHQESFRLLGAEWQTWRPQQQASLLLSVLQLPRKALDERLLAFAKVDVSP